MTAANEKKASSRVPIKRPSDAGRAGAPNVVVAVDEGTGEADQTLSVEVPPAQHKTMRFASGVTPPPPGSTAIDGASNGVRSEARDPSSDAPNGPDSVSFDDDLDAGQPPAIVVPPAMHSLSSLLDDDSLLGDSVSDEPLGALADEEPDPYVGSVLSDRYVLDRVLGEGGMGKVYRAHHKVIDKKVAVKILHSELAKDKEAVGRFLREARAASSIGNPHIVDILDFGEAADGSTYFVMEWLNGQSLGDALAELKRLTPKSAVDLAIQLCDGLAAAHAEGIVHRDLKPDNVILVKPKGTWAGQSHFVKILDFGIAKVSSKEKSTAKLTLAGAVFGTPHYMSPEQASGEVVDKRADIYALGIMLYEMLAGDVPFNAENFMGILTQHLYKAPPPLREVAHDAACPEALEAIVMKCLAKKPDDRYQSMEEVAADLIRFRDSEGTTVVRIAHAPTIRPASVDTETTLVSSGSRGARNIGPIVAGVAIGLAALAALAYAMRDPTDSPAPGSAVPSGAEVSTAAPVTPSATGVVPARAPAAASSNVPGTTAASTVGATPVAPQTKPTPVAPPPTYAAPRPKTAAPPAPTKPGKPGPRKDSKGVVDPW